MFWNVDNFIVIQQYILDVQVWSLKILYNNIVTILTTNKSYHLFNKSN